LIQIYRGLNRLNSISKQLQLHLHNEISKLYKRDLTLAFYDVTNYFFETEIEDDLRAKGVSKENHNTPIVQMGLLMDQQGIPIAYKLFRGNTLDQLTLIETIEEFQKIFNVQSITLVADKGLNSSRNLQYLISHNHKYIISQMTRNKDEKFRSKILDSTNYV
jgi:transposase